MAVKMDTHIHTSFSTDSETDMQEQILTSYLRVGQKRSAPKPRRPWPSKLSGAIVSLKQVALTCLTSYVFT